MNHLKTTEEEYVLSEIACDEISQAVIDFCTAIKLKISEVQRYRLSVEECLLFWLKNGCEGKKVILSYGIRMLSPYISIEVEGPQGNPYEDESKNYGKYRGTLLVNLNLEPSYSFSRGKNKVFYNVKRKGQSQIKILIIALVAAAIVGILGNLLIPADAKTFILENFITPLYDTFFRILGCVAGPMIFFSVAWGIYGIGDTATLGRIGKRMMLKYVEFVFLAAVFALLFLPIFEISFSYSQEQSSQVSAIIKLILNIFPSTIIEPFATGNSLQIIFMAIVIGIVLIFINKQTSHIARAVEEIDHLIQFIMRIISRLVPFVIFLVIVNLLWSDSIGVFGKSWKLALALIAAFLISMLAFVLYMSIRKKVKASTLIKKGLPTFILALSTASSAACFNIQMETCKNKHGIDPSLVNFGVPLGMVISKPMTSIYHMMLIFFFAEYYQVSASASWIITAVVISAILAIAVPPIPGGGAVAFSIIFLQMGIPDEAMGIALTIDIILDFVITAFEMYSLQLVLINIAGGLSMINEDVLRSR